MKYEAMYQMKHGTFISNFTINTEVNGTKRMNAEQGKVRCSGCKMVHRIDNFETDRLGRRRKTCLDCKRKRIVSVCDHGCRRRDCVPCVGSSVCDHGRRRNQCVPCGGGSVCDHERQRSQCRDCDPDGHLKNIISTRIVKSIGKGKGAFNVLGCSVQDFRVHIEEQFGNPGNEWMTWDNYGEWEIDHAIPLQFEVVSGVPPTLDEIIQRCHWSNTQPLRKRDNISKGNRRVDIVKKPRLNI